MSDKTTINEVLSSVIDYSDEFAITRGGKEVAVIIPIDKYMELKTAAADQEIGDGFKEISGGRWKKTESGSYLVERKRWSGITERAVVDSEHDADHFIRTGERRVWGKS